MKSNPNSNESIPNQDKKSHSDLGNSSPKGRQEDENYEKMLETLDRRLRDEMDIENQEPLEEKGLKVSVSNVAGYEVVDDNTMIVAVNNTKNAYFTRYVSKEKSDRLSAL